MSKISRGLQIAMAVLTIVGTSVALVKKYKHLRAELAPSPNAQAHSFSTTS